VVKIPHLRNLYQKIGMFGVVDIPIADPGNEPFQGDQIRGFGFLHDGSVDTIFHFLHGKVFSNTSFGGSAVGFQNDQQRLDVEQFLLAFDSNLAPVVGQQITLAADGVGGPRVDLLVARAAAGECDLTVKGVAAGEARVWYRLGDGTFQSDRFAETPLSEAALRALAAAAGQELTYTCVPPGSGQRVGVDRDGDGFFDRDELDAGSDPADPASVPGAPPTLVPTTKLVLRDHGPTKRKVTFITKTKDETAGHHVVLPVALSTGDPTQNGGELVVYDSAGLTPDVARIALPVTGWKQLGKTTLHGYRFSARGVSAPISRIVVTADKIVIHGGGAAFAYTLNEAAQGRIAVRLQLGTGVTWCADAPGATDVLGSFKAAASSAPASCPIVQ